MPIFATLLFVSLLLGTSAHEDHHDQQPLDYVKFPYDPIYRGPDSRIREGMHLELRLVWAYI